jgi:ribulose bisphosphate carboxylase small subunit
MITLTEYNRRFELILSWFNAGQLTAQEASDAMRELTACVINHHPVKEAA